MEYLNKKLILTPLKLKGSHKLVSILGFFLYIYPTIYLTKRYLLNNMSLDELISIERVEFETSKERIQETYAITAVTLSKLFKEVLRELELDILPILNVKILLHTLISIPFTNEIEGITILENLSKCMEDQLYGESRKWSCNTIASKIKKMRNLIRYEYSIEGSLKLSYDDSIEWDLMVSINFKE